LLPAEIDHVFFLLPDRFVEYNAALNRTTVLREASQTRLGKFLDMTAEKDGGAWISGSLGLARLPGPVRRINVGSEWQEFLLDTALQVQNLHHPLIDDEKTITVVGDSLALRKKVMVHFDGSAWSLRSIPGENIRGGWRGLERDFWAMTINSLFRFSGRKGDDMEREGLLSGQNFDVATEPKGVFWLATSEGLIRCAPLPWRTPTEVEEMNGLVSGILEDGAGRLWFVSRDGLIVFHEKAGERIRCRWKQN
jgi:ligand-binding sensor domain-containing protein